MADNSWVYLNGHVGFGDMHHQVVEQLAGHAGLSPQERSQLSSLLLIGATPAGVKHDVAYGHFERGMPKIWRSNIDRNHVWDAVMNARQALDQHEITQPVDGHLANRRPWFISEQGKRVLGAYGQGLNEILLGVDRRQVRHGYLMRDGRVFEHGRHKPSEWTETPSEPLLGRIKGKTLDLLGRLS